MATKTKLNRIELEVEKYRAAGNWAKLLDLSKQITSKGSDQDALANFISTEATFERFLLENQPSEKNTTKASSELADIRHRIDTILHSEIKPDYKQDAQCLMAKLFYVIGDYTNSLARLDALNLDKINIESSSNRKMRLIGEAYALKGLCLEKLPPLTNAKDTETREKQVLHCFEMAGDICLLQLQDRQERFFKTPSQSSVTNMSPSGNIWCTADGDPSAVGPFVENAIQRSPILYIRNGEISKGVGRFRDLLQAVEVRGLHGLRQLLARELAEVLLRGMCDATYSPIRVTAKSNSVSPTRKLKPKKYTGDGLFVPKNRDEEVLLLLLISESIAARDVVLNRSQEYTQARQHTLRTTISVYDLLAIVLVRYGQFGMLSETFERAMRFSFEEFHIWYQFGLSLLCSQKYSQAVLVLRECMHLEADNAVVPLLIAKVCYEHLHRWDEGIEASGLAMKCTSDRQLLAKSYVLHGVGFCLKAEDTHLETSRREFHSQALEFFLKAVSLDGSDHLSLFYVALLLALLRQIPEALKYVKKALGLRSDHLQSLQLLALLLTATKSYTQAYDLILTAIAEYPDHFSLLFIRSKLEQELQGVEPALQTCRHMLQMWKSLFEPTLDNEQRGTGLIDKALSNPYSLLHLQFGELSDRDSSSVRAESVAASRIEQALSGVASTMGSSRQPKQGPQQMWSIQTQIWLEIAELYISVDKLDSANACIQEANSIFPISHMVSYMKGRLAEHKEEFNEAKSFYENAVSINPAHVRSLQHLGLVMHMTGNQHVAEKVLRDAVNSDPMCSKSWQFLGDVLLSLGETESASQCLITAVDLEATSPIMPFSTVPKTLQ
ncbi:hypothetical protein NP493_20g07035 [Ridgeia piscesae]|uniref:Tetratricopeptide repeat protein 7 N-terminal domain-containing protein n=1 Tax=Ridgeia piscesae TaxID=27915 RepID=A0AAD9UKJ0_RIDPI|nr:hypothetical protein NP493_20g07035 [Ridgeia piscesae]